MGHSVYVNLGGLMMGVIQCANNAMQLGNVLRNNKFLVQTLLEIMKAAVQKMLRMHVLSVMLRKIGY